MLEASRAGQYVEQLEGYKAFIPNPLPPVPGIIMDQEMWNLLSQADRGLGQCLKGKAMLGCLVSI